MNGPLARRAAWIVWASFALAACGSGSTSGPPARSAEGSKSGFGFPVVRRIDADSNEVGRANWRYGRDIYDPTAEVEEIKPSPHDHEHAQLATELGAFTDAECRFFPPKVRTTCPLLRVVATVEPTPRGVRLILKEGVDPEIARSHMRCHHVFGLERRQSKMESCPLYLHGIDLISEPTTGSVRLESGDPATVIEIRKRTLRSREQRLPVGR